MACFFAGVSPGAGHFPCLRVLMHQRLSMMYDCQPYQYSLLPVSQLKWSERRRSTPNKRTMTPDSVRSLHHGAPFDPKSRRTGPASGRAGEISRTPQGSMGSGESKPAGAGAPSRKRRKESPLLPHEVRRMGDLLNRRRLSYQGSRHAVTLLLYLQRASVTPVRVCEAAMLAAPARALR